jgi:dihydroxynaphthoic acid synthetase
MEFSDILYEKKGGVAKIVINRPAVYNAFRTLTIKEMVQSFEDAEADQSVGVVVLTGTGNKAFCTGGDAKEVVEKGGYDPDMSIFIKKLHNLIVSLSKPVIAAVNGFAIGGGHVIQVLCDLSIAAENAKFGQVGPKVGSFDAGFGSVYLARVVGIKRAKEIWFLCRQYTAQEALTMGLVNKVVPADKLEEETNAWCRDILALSPTALKFLKASFYADISHASGIDAVSSLGTATFSSTEESLEGRKAFLEKRAPEFFKHAK